jgi:hypothetical protein
MNRDHWETVKMMGKNAKEKMLRVVEGVAARRELCKKGWEASYIE